ncbi:MAG: YbjN domain-containing protein [Polyangiales bacterium]
MRTTHDVERYLEAADIPYQDYGDGLFVVTDGSGHRDLAIKVEPPVVVFRLKVGEVPEPGAPEREALFEELLRLNGTDLLHAAFCIAPDGVYLTAALPLDNLDQNEFQAVVDDIGMAMSQHLPLLRLPRSN